MLTLLLISLFLMFFTPSISQHNGGVFIPFYVDPQVDTADWTRLKVTATQNPSIQFVVVVNPADGPGINASVWYVDALSEDVPENLQFLGYVLTTNNEKLEFREETKIEGDIDGWYEFYGNYISGIYLDKVPNRWSGSLEGSKLGSKGEQIQIYEDIANYVNEYGSDNIVALNPGGPSWEEFYEFADLIVIIEGSTQDWTGNQNGACSLRTYDNTTLPVFGPGAFCKFVRNWDGVDNLKLQIESNQIPNTKSVALLYGATNSELDPLSIPEYILKSGVGIFWYYITDKNCGAPDWENCWGQLASSLYLDGLAYAITNTSILELTNQDTMQPRTTTVTGLDPQLEVLLVFACIILVLALFLTVVALCMACRKVRREDDYHMQQW